ncbi:multi-sensor signal transduction histidine kinase [Haloferax elongans ATCC BAA-1513]|uniref:histidine kinase n=1 Tax=Haloferax elongans ATCC BAA-1513 TaxID=1230453 RepID=M0HJ54_HALEO|nr:histidine kinase N-terminal 7TM domain-containing protein [Haloferax elongans]ELZ84565.1 multi-sensor signal transduction histidine kinase [Haloferax elongans ATCC BAA-1513]
MTPSTLAVSFLELTIGVVCLAITALSWRYRERPGGLPLVVMAFSAAIWSVAAGVASLFVSPDVTRAAQTVVYIVIGPAAVAWFYVVVEYSGHEWWKQKLVVGGLLGLVGLEWVGILTNPLHHLYATGMTDLPQSGLIDPTPGVILYGYTLVRVTLMLIGLSILLERYASARGVSKIQTASLVFTGVLPVSTGFLELMDFVRIPGLDFSVIGIVLSSGVVLWALFYADFLEFVPVARVTLFENMTDPVVAVDTDGRVVDLNGRAKLLFGVGDDAIGMPTTAVFEEYPQLSTAPVGTSAEPIEITAEVDGLQYQYELAVSPIVPRSAHTSGSKDALNSSLGFLFVFRDVTLQKQREQAIERKNDRLEQFASVVSHDLRNPLNVAQGWVALARDDNDSESLAKVTQAHERMELLIENLLTLARSGNAISETKPVNIAELAHTCWQTVETADATLTVDTDLTVHADPARLQELVENVLRNAIDHGGEDVTITIGTLGDDRGFYIADDGGGIPLEAKEQIFESGYSTGQDGTGLGLAIVAEIATAHGWRIGVTDSGEGGARFEFVTERGDS